MQANMSETPLSHPCVRLCQEADILSVASIGIRVCIIHGYDGTAKGAVSKLRPTLDVLNAEMIQFKTSEQRCLDALDPGIYKTLSGLMLFLIELREIPGVPGDLIRGLHKWSASLGIFGNSLLYPDPIRFFREANAGLCVGYLPNLPKWKFRLVNEIVS